MPMVQEAPGSYQTDMTVTKPSSDSGQAWGRREHSMLLFEKAYSDLKLNPNIDF